MHDAAYRTDIRLRQMSKDDLPAALRLSQEAQWPHRLEDWHFVLRLGSGIVAERDGAVVGTAMCWPFGADVATLGMVIVSDAHRGAGIGRRLMEASMVEAGERSLMLVSTAAGKPLYEKLGFRAIGEVRQHNGAHFTVAAAPVGSGERLRAATAADLPMLADLDQRATGLSRHHVMAALGAVADIVVLERAAKAIGFACCRPFGRGHVIGPVVAPDAASAKALTAHWLAVQVGRFVRIDVRDESGLSPWLDSVGLAGGAPATAMVRGMAPQPQGPARSFALVNQALG